MVRVLLSVVALSAVFTASAWAHGGNFKGGNPVAPGNGAGPPAPGVPTPVTTGPGSPNRGRGNGNLFWLDDGWQAWWMLNAAALLPERTARTTTTNTSEGLFDLGRPGPGSLGEAELLRQRIVSKEVLPLLLRIVDPLERSDPGLVATALIAIGRVSTGDEMAVRLLKRFVLDKTQPLEVHESAVLGLGLMRRTDPAERLPQGVLDDLRSFLLGTFDDKKASTRVRAFSMYAIALLSDQPYRDVPAERHGRQMTRSLWRRMYQKFPAADLRIALLTAMSMQPQEGVPQGVRHALRQIIVRKSSMGRRWDGFQRSHALTALARLERGPNCNTTLFHVLGKSREHVAVRGAAAIALGERAERMVPAARLAAIDALQASIKKEPNVTARGLTLIAMGQLLGADLRAESTLVLVGSRAARFLQNEAYKGSTRLRPYASIALGLACRDVRPFGREAIEFQRASVKLLHKGLTRGRGPDEDVGAYAAALGLTRSEVPMKDMLEIAQHRGSSGVLRSHCALGLGLMGKPRENIVNALRRLLDERLSGAVFLGAVKALAMLGVDGTAETLERQLRLTRSLGGQAAIAAGLGRLRDARTVPSLIELAEDDGRNTYLRSMAVVALGLICDPEPVESRARLTAGANYPARSASLQQLFNIM